MTRIQLMHRFFSMVIFLIPAAIPCVSQNKRIDSLRSLVNVLKEDTSKVNAFNGLSKEFYLSSQQDSALVYGEKAKALADKLNFEKGIANSYSNIGNVKVAKSDFAGATKDYQTALELRTKINDRKGIATCYTNFAVIQYSLGNYPEALKHNLTALKIEQEDNDKTAIARTYNNMGNVYIQQMDHEEALKYYRKALEIQKEIGDKQGMGRSYNNMGAVLFRQKKYSEALKYLEDGLSLKKETGDESGMGRAYINLASMRYLSSFEPGLTEKQRKEILQRAIDDLFLALKIMEGIGDQQGIIMCYNNLGSFHVNLGKSNEAIAFLKKGIALAKEIGSRHDIKSGYEALHSADSAAGNWKAAYEDHKLFLHYRDSLMNEENTKKMVEAQLNFEFEQKETKARAEQEKKDAVFEEQIKAQRTMVWASIALFILALITVILLFNRSRLKQKQRFQQQLMEQQKEQAIAVMETQERERKRIAEDLHDSLGHLLSTVKLNLQTLPDDQRHYYVNALQLLNQASTEIRNISFDLMPQTLEEEGLIPALHELAEKIRKSSLYDIILMVHDMENFELDKQTKFNIYRIVQEAVNNIMKHAEAKEINIQLIKQEQQLTIMIEDDGKGFNMSEMKRSGRGLQNITARAQWLHGTIGIDSTPGRGTTISIDIPLDQKK